MLVFLLLYFCLLRYDMVKSEVSKYSCASIIRHITRRRIPEGSSLHCHRQNNFKIPSSLSVHLDGILLS